MHKDAGLPSLLTVLFTPNACVNDRNSKNSFVYGKMSFSQWFCVQEICMLYICAIQCIYVCLPGCICNALFIVEHNEINVPMREGKAGYPLLKSVEFFGILKMLRSNFLTDFFR